MKTYRIVKKVTKIKIYATKSHGIAKNVRKVLMFM